MVRYTLFSQMIGLAGFILLPGSFRDLWIARDQVTASVFAQSGGTNSSLIETVLFVLVISLALSAIGLGAGLLWLKRQKKQIQLQIKALQKSEERFRILYDEAPLSYQSLNEQGCLIDVNPAWTKAMGYQRDEVLGLWMGDFMTPSSRERFRMAFDCFKTDGVVHGIEFQLMRKNGQVMTVSVEGRVSRSQGSDFRQTHCIFYDVSARQRAQDALRLSEERFAKAFRISPDSININRLKDGLFIDINEGFCKMTGYERFEVIGKTSLELNIWADPENRKQMVTQLLSSGEVIDFEARFEMKDGRVRTGLMSARTLEINNEQCILSITRDITERKLAEDEIRRQVKRLAALHDIDIAITSGSNLQETLAVLLKNVSEQLNVDGGTVLLYRPSTQILEFGCSYGIDPPCRLNPITREAFSIAWNVAQNAQPIFIQPLKNSGQHTSVCASHLCNLNYSAYYAYPLVTKSGPIGVLEVFRKEAFTPDSDWLQFLVALASQAAIAIENTRLFGELEQANAEMTLAYDETIQGLVRALELRDGDTEGHSQRVTDMTVRLAQAMGHQGEDLVHIRRGALLHDLGKMGVPDSILRKPGELTPEEMQIMQEHPRLAYTFLSGIDFLHKALDIPYYHHEHWDGSGYPEKRKGEEIPLAARIFAVVDVWDALRSDRPYRKQWPVDVVQAYLRTLSGKQFDPSIVTCFLELLQQDPSIEKA